MEKGVKKYGGSNDVYENKGRKKRHFGGSKDVDENKQDSWNKGQIPLMSHKKGKIIEICESKANIFLAHHRFSWK